MRHDVCLRVLAAALCAAALIFGAGAAFAQGSGEAKPPEQKPAAEAAKEGQKSIDEIAEASRTC